MPKVRFELFSPPVANRVLICDTSAFITGTLFERYMGNRNEEVEGRTNAGIQEIERDD